MFSMILEFFTTIVYRYQGVVGALSLFLRLSELPFSGIMANFDEV